MMAIRPVFFRFYAVHQKTTFDRHSCWEDQGQNGPLRLFSVRFHHGGFALPVDTKGRIGNHEVKLIAGKFIIGQGVAKLHIVRVTTVNHGIRY